MPRSKHRIGCSRSREDIEAGALRKELHGRRDLADTIRRLRAFEAAGADVLYAPGLSSLDDIRAVTAAVGKPVNVLMSGFNSNLTVAELTSAGWKRNWEPAM